jgi:transposase-like protein
MPMNRIQFQTGLSMPDFLSQFGTEAQCEIEFEKTRWLHGFVCPRCTHTEHSAFRVGVLKIFQCCACRHQTSLIAGTLFQSTKLSLTKWFLAMYFISQAKTNVSALALKRFIGVSYPTAWLVHHKLMQAMSESESIRLLSGFVLLDDAYLGGELTGGKAGRGSENKVPFVAAVSLDDENHVLYAKLTPISGFTSVAIAEWAKANLEPDCEVLSDGLACFAAVSEAGCEHQVIVAGGRKPKELPEFLWLNIILGNLKTSLSGTYHAFKFAKYASRYLAAFAYRFNHRFQLDKLPMNLFMAAIAIRPRPEAWLRSAEVSC